MLLLFNYYVVLQEKNCFCSHKGTKQSLILYFHFLPVNSFWKKKMKNSGKKWKKKENKALFGSFLYGNRGNFVLLSWICPIIKIYAKPKFYFLSPQFGIIQSFRSDQDTWYMADVDFVGETFWPTVELESKDNFSSWHELCIFDNLEIGLKNVCKFFVHTVIVV